MINESKYLDYQPGHPLFVAGKPKLNNPARLRAIVTALFAMIY
jgi:hypothetical protein